jgi:hypothetical protein
VVTCHQKWEFQMKLIAIFRYEQFELELERLEYVGWGRVAVMAWIRSVYDRDLVESNRIPGAPWGALSINLAYSPDPRPDCFYAKTSGENVRWSRAAFATGFFTDTSRSFEGFPVWKIEVRPVTRH